MAGSRFLVWCVLVAMGCGDEEAPANAPPAASPATPTTPTPTPPVSPPPSTPTPAAEPASPEGPALAPAPEAPTPLVTADVPVDENGTPSVVGALRGASRIGEGPWLDEDTAAIGAGFVDLSTADVTIAHELERGRSRFVLALAPVGEASPDHDRADELRSLWLAQVESRGDEAEGTREHRRIAAIRLYDGALPSNPLDGSGGGAMSAFTCETNVDVDLRARDIDDDREVEVTVVAPYLRPTDEEWQGGGAPDECGAVAFIVGVTDWNVQAAFTRDYAVQAYAASIEVGEKRSTTWQLRDVDGDGRSDLHVTERWRFLDSFMGDYVGDGETMPASRDARSDRRELDCLYSAEHDAWRCPLPAPGTLLFAAPESRGSLRGTRPW